MLLLFLVLANISMVATIVLYFKQVVDGDSIPNPATWFVWSVITTLNAITYFLVLQGDIFKSMVTIIVAVGVSGIFLYSLLKGKMGKVGIVEILSLVLCVAVFIFWMISGNAVIANLLIQVILIIGFCPTIIGLLRHELQEKPLAWDVAVFSQLMLAFAILCDWQGNWPALVYPLVNGVLGNGAVSVISRIQNREIK